MHLARLASVVVEVEVVLVGLRFSATGEEVAAVEAVALGLVVAAGAVEHDLDHSMGVVASSSFC